MYVILLSSPFHRSFASNSTFLISIYTNSSLELQGAIIRYSLANYNLSQHKSISIASPTNDLFIFDSCLSVPFCEDELRTILALDTEQSRTLLGMPSARMFVDTVLGERGLRC
jgi:hypothetical protein